MTSLLTKEAGSRPDQTWTFGWDLMINRLKLTNLLHRRGLGKKSFKDRLHRADKTRFEELLNLIEGSFEAKRL